MKKSQKQSLLQDPQENLAKVQKKDYVRDITTQSLTFEHVGQICNKKKKKYKIISCISSCFLILGLLLALLLPFLFQKIVINTAIQKAVLSKDNQQFWAHFPGDSGTVITRNYTFFNFTNQQAFFLYGSKPKLRQIQGYIITEMEDYLDIQYFQDGNKVRMRDWLHFDVHPDSKPLTQTVDILNIPSLGYWYMLKNSRDSLIFLQAFATLFTSIQAQIINSIIGQGMSTQYFPNFNTTYFSLFQTAGLSKQNSTSLWNDPIFGFNDKNNVKTWVNAANQSFDSQMQGLSKDARYLQQYFVLTDQQIYSILEQVNVYADALQNLLLTNYYCANISSCNGRQLAIRQIASSYITNNPPPVANISSQISICNENSTCKGYYPQLYSYYKQIYLVQHQQADHNLLFPIDIVTKWLDYNPSRIKGQYNKNQSVLLHIGNLDVLFNNGYLHDLTKKNHFFVTEYLVTIKNRFQIDSDASTIVFWQWIKYLINNVFRQESIGNQKLGIANSFSNAMYSSFIYLQDNLLQFILTIMIKNKLITTTCFTLIQNSLQTNDYSLISNVCSKYGHNIASDEFLHDSISACKHKYGPQWIKVKSIGITRLQMESFCDPLNKYGFGGVFHNMNIQINDFYQCDYSHHQYCSDYELALKQWANSTVTLNQPFSFNNMLQKSTTFKDWNGNASSFEYHHYTKKFPNKTFPLINIAQAYNLFNFDNIYSATQNLKVFKNPQTNILWKDYMRYVVVFIGFRGLNYPRSTKQFIFGFTDQYLQFRKNNYPPFGGDPSTPSFLAFNDLNTTADEATLKLEWYTGKDDFKMTSQYYKINHLQYLTLNYTRFNGNQTYSVLQTPWAQNDFFYGTSGKSFAPNQQIAQNVSIYVPNLQRYGSGSLQSSQPTIRYGYDLKLFFLGQYIYQTGNQYAPNKKYYQNYYAVFNQTSVLGFPFFITKHHFMNCTPNWTQHIDIYNHNQSIKYQTTSYWDDSYIIVQPYSGVSFQSTINIQANYFYQPDELFTFQQTMMIPVFSIYRSGNLTQQKANQLFSSLQLVNKLSQISLYIGIVFSALGFVWLIFSLIKIKYINRKLKLNDQSIRISSQSNQQIKYQQPKLINYTQVFNQLSNSINIQQKNNNIISSRSVQFQQQR